MSFNDEMLENFGRELPANYDFAAEREYDDGPVDFQDYDDEPQDFRDDVEADADALRGIGWGTDEDYYSEPYDCDLWGEC